VILFIINIFKTDHPYLLKLKVSLWYYTEIQTLAKQRNISVFFSYM